jgi:hypothetical protein
MCHCRTFGFPRLAGDLRHVRGNDVLNAQDFPFEVIARSFPLTQDFPKFFPGILGFFLW